MLTTFFIFLLWSVPHLTSALDNGLALTPPMGFLAYERFRCEKDCVKYPDTCQSEKFFRQIADAIISEGYRDLGYVYVNIDDCWSAKTRDPHGNLMPDPDRFPSGMLNLSRYMHDRGLKLGIYADVGTKTCQGFPGSQDHVRQDAQTFASWEIDLLKFDGCHTTFELMDIKYPEMSNELNATGRPILFSCEWAAYDYLNTHEMYERNKKYCNTWRNFFDDQDQWFFMIATIAYYAINLGNFSGVAGPGGFNDPDQLIVGDFSLSYDREKVQFGMWAMFASPLYISADIRNLRPQAKAILQNKEVIAINQDPLGRQADLFTIIDDSVQVWRKPLVSPGSWAVAFFNPYTGPMPVTVTLTLAQIKLENVKGYTLRDVFDGVDMGTSLPSDPLKITVNPTGIVIVKMTPLK